MGSESSVVSILKSSQSAKRVSKHESVGLVLEDSLGSRRGTIVLKGNNEGIISSNSLRAIVFLFSKDLIDKSLALTLRCSTQAVNCKILKIENIDIQDEFKILELEIELERDSLSRF